MRCIREFVTGLLPSFNVNCLTPHRSCTAGPSAAIISAAANSVNINFEAVGRGEDAGGIVEEKLGNEKVEKKMKEKV